MPRNFHVKLNFGNKRPSEEEIDGLAKLAQKYHAVSIQRNPGMGVLRYGYEKHDQAVQFYAEALNQYDFKSGELRRPTARRELARRL